MAKSGLHSSNELRFDVGLPSQIGQPWRAIRLATDARQACFESLEHFHHTRRSVEYKISSGSMLPFFSTSHSLMRPKGNRSNQLSTVARLPKQNGHPVPRQVRFLIVARHSWCAFTGQHHHAFMDEVALQSCGFASPFLVGCHC
jgi:hypothetical protein